MALGNEALTLLKRLDPYIRKLHRSSGILRLVVELQKKLRLPKPYSHSGGVKAAPGRVPYIYIGKEIGSLRDRDVE
jgi:hypothetical protein